MASVARETPSARARWQNEGLLRNAWLATGCATVAELVALEGFDAVTIDLQHGILGLDRCVEILGTLQRFDPIPLVRVSSLDSAEIGKVLDAGARGVISPGIESAADALRLVRHCRYPPHGDRSVTAFPPRMEDRRAKPEAAKPLAIAMIESAAAVDRVREIAGVAGLDGLYIGPSDLGLSMVGTSGLDREEPGIAAAIAAIAAAGREFGLRVGLHGLSREYWSRWASAGVSFVTVTTDVRLIQDGARRALDGVG